MSGPIPINNVPSQLNLPSRTNRDQKQQRKKPAKHSIDEGPGTESDDTARESETTNNDNSQDNHIGTQLDVEA